MTYADRSYRTVIFQRDFASWELTIIRARSLVSAGVSHFTWPLHKHFHVKPIFAMPGRHDVVLSPYGCNGVKQPCDRDEFYDGQRAAAQRWTMRTNTFCFMPYQEAETKLHNSWRHHVSRTSTTKGLARSESTWIIWIHDDKGLKRFVSTLYREGLLKRKRPSMHGTIF